MHHVAVRLGPGRVAGEQRSRRLGRLVGDPHVLGLHDVVTGNAVHAAPAVHGEDDLVAGFELIDVAERMIMSDAVAGKDGVTWLAGEGGARPMAWAVVDV